MSLLLEVFQGIRKVERRSLTVLVDLVGEIDVANRCGGYNAEVATENTQRTRSRVLFQQTADVDVGLAVVVGLGVHAHHPVFT